MAIEIKKLTTEEHQEALVEGDRITVSATLESKVNRDSMWSKYEASSIVRHGETTEEASERVIAHVKTRVVDATIAIGNEVMSRA